MQSGRKITKTKKALRRMPPIFGLRRNSNAPPSAADAAVARTISRSDERRSRKYRTIGFAESHAEHDVPCASYWGMISNAKVLITLISERRPQW